MISLAFMIGLQHGSIHDDPMMRQARPGRLDPNQERAIEPDSTQSLKALSTLTPRVSRHSPISSIVAT
ncbi:MAG: hypothetical protein WC590_10340, partial [Burkholderiaceae bacterium]